jgi:hypothetical protein
MWWVIVKVTRVDASSKMLDFSTNLTDCVGEGTENYMVIGCSRWGGRPKQFSIFCYT